MNRKTRETVHAKYNGRCAYCGQAIRIEDMQVDHKRPKRAGGTDDIDNLMPSCRRCNHYKRAERLEYFRENLIDMRRKVLGTYLGKVATDYGMIEWHEWDGKFYFERQEASTNECL